MQLFLAFTDNFRNFSGNSFIIYLFSGIVSLNTETYGNVSFIGSSNGKRIT